MIGSMVVSLAAVVACFVDEASPSPKDAADLATYEAARKEAGRDAQAHVRLALWCEAHGMSAERLKHLATAVLHDPSNVLARGLMGLVAYQGKWERPDQVSRQVQDDPKQKALIQEYLQRRAKAPDTADGHWKLATWCEQNGLKQQANAHFHQVLKQDPSRDGAWRHLGFKKSAGRWVKPELVAAAKARAREQQHADKHWKPILERYRSGLQSKNPERRAKAEWELAQVTDRGAVPMVWATFGHGDAALQKMAVQVFGQIDDGSASRKLALLAVFGGSATVRGEALAVLRRRDAREFAAMLISMVLEPIEYEVKRVGGPGQGGELLIKGQGSAANRKRLYSPPGVPVTPRPGDRVSLDQNGLPVIARPESTWEFQTTLGQITAMTQYVPPNAQQQSQLGNMLSKSGLGAMGQRVSQALILGSERQAAFYNSNPYLSPNPYLRLAASSLWLRGPSQIVIFQMIQGEILPVGRMAIEAEKVAMVAEKQLECDVASIEDYNRSLNQINDRVVPVLKEISGLDIGPKPIAWRNWYVNLVGYSLKQIQSSNNPTVIEQVPLAYQPQPIPIGQFMGPTAARSHSCFGAGTLVRTLDGLKPIETLKVGDPVLTQSTLTGALTYKPVLVVHHNPPNKTFRVSLGGETIVSSEIHRFWKAGQGWVMARDLKEKDLLRTLDGPARIERIEQGEVVPVYNLDVAENADFFVGKTGALVHDITLPDLWERPFDAVEPLATSMARPAVVPSVLGR